MLVLHGDTMSSSNTVRKLLFCVLPRNTTSAEIPRKLHGYTMHVSSEQIDCHHRLQSAGQSSDRRQWGKNDAGTASCPQRLFAVFVVAVAV